MILLLYEDLRPRGIAYSKTHIWRLERQGKFPRRVTIGGGNRYGWPEDEIDQYLTKRVEDRDANRGTS